MIRAAALALVALAIFSAPAGGDAGDLELSPEQARRRWTERLDGAHFSADVVLRVVREGREEERRLLVWRDDEGRTRERLMARFEAPFDLRGVALLYLENADRANDYFFFQPATGRVRRVPDAVARQDVYGVDLEYLGFGVAQSERTEIEAGEPATLGGRATYKLTERARDPNPRFDRRHVWLDPVTFVPLRIEHLRQGKVALAAEAHEVRTVQGIPTPMRVTFERPGETVVMQVERIDYEAPIPESFFSTLALVKR